MASFASQSQESRTEFPSEVMSGEDDPPVPSSNFKNQKQSGFSVPFSPQLRYSLSRKQPRIWASPPASSSFSPSAKTVESIVNGSYFKVPIKWCRDNRLWSGDFYLSRNSLLKKLIHQSILDRKGQFETEEDKVLDKRGMLALKSSEDCWVTFPIQPLIKLENVDVPRFEDLFEFVEDDEIAPEPTSIGYVNQPVKSTRYSVKLVSHRPEPHFDGLPFPWVTNTTGTKFLDRWCFYPPDLQEVPGYVECPICGEIWRIEHIFPPRFDRFDIQLDSLGETVNERGEEVVRLCGTYFNCRCDGNDNPVRPIISDNMNKIDWLFLLLGYMIGHCTIDQLKYYCNHRKLPISDNSSKIRFAVFDDLCHQIFLRRVGS